MLKLRAKDAEDIEIISAVLQDSIVPVCDMVFQGETQSFIIVAQRLRREAGASGERICSALTIKGVTAVHAQGIDKQQCDRMLDLLAIIIEPAQRLTFIFAGEARIRLDLAAWSAVVEDFGEPWPVQCRPCHDENAEGKP
jgi:hypothetical protein